MNSAKCITFIMKYACMHKIRNFSTNISGVNEVNVAKSNHKVSTRRIFRMHLQTKTKQNKLKFSYVAAK